MGFAKAPALSFIEFPILLGSDNQLCALIPVEGFVAPVVPV
jgi:hypothetical protein